MSEIAASPVSGVVFATDAIIASALVLSIVGIFIGALALGLAVTLSHRARALEDALRETRGNYNHMLRAIFLAMFNFDKKYTLPHGAASGSGLEHQVGHFQATFQSSLPMAFYREFERLTNVNQFTGYHDDEMCTLRDWAFSKTQLTKLVATMRHDPDNPSDDENDNDNTSDARDDTHPEYDPASSVFLRA